MIVVIRGTNDAPVVTAAATVATDENAAPVTVNLLEGASDADVSNDLDISGVTIAVAGSSTTPWTAPITFTPDEEAGTILLDPAQFAALDDGQTLTLTVSYGVTDGSATTAATRTITVTGSNDGPVLGTVASPASVAEDVAASAQDILLTGSFDVSDVDAADTLSIVQGTAVLALSNPAGTVPVGLAATLSAALSASATANSTSGAPQSIAWTFDASDLNLDFLAQGQTLTVTFPISVSDGTATSAQQSLVITITGTNDAPVVSGNVTASVDEDDANPATVNLLANASDVDTGANLDVASVTLNQGSWVPAVTYSVDTATGALTFDPAQFNSLAEGESATLTFTYNVIDGLGGVTPATTVVTVTGSNDAPVMTASTVINGGTVAEPAGSPGPAPTPVSGTFTFSDADTTDTHTASRSLVSVAGASGPALTAEQIAAAEALLTAFTASVNGTTPTQIDWSFSPTAGALDFLRVSQSATLTFRITVDDGNGGTATRDVTVTLTGSNDPITAIAGGVVTGGVTELAEGDPSTAPQTATGSFRFTDPDLTANPVQVLNHLGVVGGASQWGGVLTQETVLTNAATGERTVTWTYTINPSNSNLQSLGEGDTRTETFTIRVLDQVSGGELEQVITITLTGTNDRPVITATEVTGSATEANAGTMLSDSGSIAFDDIDDADNGHHHGRPDLDGLVEHLWHLPTGLTAALEGAFDLGGTLVGNSGTATWSFALDSGAVDFLAAGESLTVTYTITATDDSGTGNGAATQTVVITLTGSNDVPTLASATINVADTAAADTFAPFTGQLDGDDLDATDTLTYALAEGEDGVGTTAR